MIKVTLTNTETGNTEEFECRFIVGVMFCVNGNEGDSTAFGIGKMHQLSDTVLLGKYIASEVVDLNSEMPARTAKEMFKIGFDFSESAKVDKADHAQAFFNHMMEEGFKK